MEETTSFVRIYGFFDESTLRSFKNSLRTFGKTNGKTLKVRLNSSGGNVHIMNTMSAFLYYLIKYKNIDVIIEIEYAESAAIMFAVNFKRRVVTKKSIGQIHLPIHSPKSKNHIPQTRIDEIRNESIAFFVSKTNLNKEGVILLNDVKLSAAKMIQTGIATELVEEFM